MAITLEDLPFDIVDIIVHKLHKEDLSNLAKTSKTLHEKVQSEVYRDFDLLSTSNGHRDLAEERFIRPLVVEGQLEVPQQGVYQFIRNLTFRSFPHGHQSLPLVVGTNLADAALRPFLQRMVFERMEGNVGALLACLPDDMLHSFNWHIGCDLPTGLFDRGGYLATHQRKLKALSVKVEPGYLFPDNLDGLRHLRNLRHFSWQGADFIDSYAFSDVIMRNTRRLESLDLGYQYNGQIATARDLALSSTCLFSPSENPPVALFRALQSVCLRNMSLQLIFSTLQPNFDFSRLRSLKLRDCRYVLNFLRGARIHNLEINLKELDIDYVAPTTNVADVTAESEIGGLAPEFSRFLQGFKGLEKLYYRAMESSHDSRMQNPLGIINHASTLKRLVCHYHDKLALGPRKDCPLACANGLKSIFNETRLESVGLSVLPCDLRPFIEETETAQTVKLLHLRITGQYHTPQNMLHKLKIAGLRKECVPISERRPKRIRSSCIPVLPADNPLRLTLVEGQRRVRRLLNMMELLAFVKWAFSPNGLPNLQIFAYGDFSQKRFAWSQLIFVRYPRPNMCVPGAQTDPSGIFGEKLPFRLMRPEDSYLFDEIDGSREILEACPVSLQSESHIAQPLVHDDLDEVESYFSDTDLEGGSEMDDEETWDEFEDDFFY